MAQNLNQMEQLRLVSAILDANKKNLGKCEDLTFEPLSTSQSDEAPSEPGDAEEDRFSWNRCVNLMLMPYLKFLILYE